MSCWRDWRQWWKALSPKDKEIVRAWLDAHPVPDYWIEGKIAYAFTEMPSRLLSRS